MVNVKLELKNSEGTTYKDWSASHDTKKLKINDFFKGISKKDIQDGSFIEVYLYSDLKSCLSDQQEFCSEDSMWEEFKDTILNNINLANFKFKKNTFLRIQNVIFVGCSSIKSPEDWRDLGFNLIKYVRKDLPGTITIRLQRNVNSDSKPFFEGVFLADYNFIKYKSNQKRLHDINLLVSPAFPSIEKDEFERPILVQEIGNKIKEAQQKVAAQNIARDWVNTHPELANSKNISLDILNRFKGSKNIKLTIYDEKKLESLNMRGHLAVNRASKFEALVVKIEYTPNNFVQSDTSKHIVGVGKGLTYDCGGLSIKPSNSMTTMKADKGGAIALYGFMDIISKQSSTNKITCYLAFAENMINEEAYRPDDILLMKNGKTVHVKNTDAEGRIVLFDSLCLAQEENPKLDEIFSIATLTGAAVYQFGHECAGMVSKEPELFDKFYKIGKQEDELFCEAKLHKFMLDGVNDSISDLSNTGTPNQGCQKAGLFLMNAINNKNIKKYIHLDIAGPAFVEKAFGTNPAGATGFGVRTLFESYK